MEIKPVYWVEQELFNALGTNQEACINQILNEQTGLKTISKSEFSNEPTILGLTDRTVTKPFLDLDYTLFEAFLLHVAESALSKTSIDISSPDTIIIYTSTKGNIELLNQNIASRYTPDRLHLWKSAQIVNSHFKNPNTPYIISNACISGVQGLITGLRLLQNGIYRHAVVIGADLISQFVASGFLSFKSLSSRPCKPFDRDRDGLSLGEGAACIILSTDAKKAHPSGIDFVSGATANDANHISGPSRTAEGQYYAMLSAGVQKHQIDFISAHGTATPYNDDMESVAIARHGLGNVPVNSFKGYFGHTLGAAGLIETALSIYSLQHNILFKTLGFENPGTVELVNVVQSHQKAHLNTVLKLASGFGGSNAALIIKKQ